MQNPFLLSRVLMHFQTTDTDVHGELSSVAVTPDGSMWLGSDEMLAVERLSPIEPYVFGEHCTFHINDFVELFNDDDEIDIEGIDYDDGYLWVTGSHSVKRKKVKGKKEEKDIERLSIVYPEVNRYTLARFPVLGGELLQTCSHPDNPDQMLRAAMLHKREGQNILVEALKEDEHLAPFLSIPNKENGFDVEGLAVRGNRVFLGLRGPVLRGLAVILELELEEQEPGILAPTEIEDTSGQYYKKHFVDLNGLGIREICLQDDDMLILAGPTMDLEGAMEIFRLHDVLDLEADSITLQDSDDLEPLFYLPFTIGSDHAEGLALFPALGQKSGMLVVYDSPNPERRVSEHALFADIFRLDE